MENLYKVVRLFPYQGGVEIEQKVLEGVAEVYERPCFSEEDVIKNAQDADAIILVYEPLTKKVLDALPNLKFISYKSIGFNSVDLEYATEKGIPVAHITQYCTQEVADYVMAAILMANRRMLQFHNSVKNDKEWNYALHPEMKRLAVETVGFIGFGNIPKLVAQRLAPYGCELIAYDPYVTEDQAAKYGVKLVSKAEIFERADYISSHLPLNPSTEKSINAEDFNSIKESAVFINSSRGGVVDEDALYEALENGKISMAILDVLTDEYPDIETDKLANHKNVILTPHIAFYSQQSVVDGQKESALNIKRFFAGDYSDIEFVNNVIKK